MGLNINLNDLINAPKVVTCPKCRKVTKTNFASYDIETDCYKASGQWELLIGCEHCDHEFYMKAQIGILTATFVDAT